MEFSIASMHRIFKQVGGESGKVRVSNDAKELLRKILDEIAREIAYEAIKLTYLRGQSTVTEEDVRDAASIVLVRRENSGGEL